MQSVSAVPKRPQPRGGSRKGVPNKVPKTIKVELLAAFDMVGARRYLAKQAIANPPAFMHLLGKVLPPEVREEAVAGVTFLIQQLNVQGAPIKGVTNSPVAEHVERIEVAA